VRPASSVDLRRDFVPIGQTGNSVYALVASPALGAKTLAEVIALAKAKPGELKIGSVGVGSTHHLIAEMLKAAAAIDLTHVPIAGGAGRGRRHGWSHRPDVSHQRQTLHRRRPGARAWRSSAQPWFNLPGLKPLSELGLRGFVDDG
jgi:hypothetical protein